jgi:ribonuclease HII
MLSFYSNPDEGGLDEAGRGPLIGNVYAAVVIWSPNLTPPIGLIKDSKKLSPKKRKIAFDWIVNNVPDYAIGWANNNEIDNINILEATKLAMQRAIDQLKVRPNNFIIDGLGWEKKFSEYEIKSIVKGDNKYYSIAAASILAKEVHDEHIRNLCLDNVDLNEKYDLLNNMGYPTKKHIEGVRTYGYSNYHRKSYNIKN